MKRLFSLICLSVSLLVYTGNIVSWDTTPWNIEWSTGTVTGNTSVEAQFNMWIFDQASSDIDNIRVKFCNYDYKLEQYKISPWAAQDICLEIGNNAKRDIPITIEFVDGTVTSDKGKNRACKANGDNKLFGQYVSGITSPIVIPANGTIIRHATLHYPSEIKGKISGCLVYYANWAMMWWPKISFNILIRKALFIDTLIKPHFLLLYGRKILWLLIVIIIWFRKNIRHYIFPIRKKIKSKKKTNT